MKETKTKRRGISYPMFIIAVFVALASASTAIVCTYQLYRSNQTNYRAVQQLQASIAQLSGQPPEAPESLGEALSIMQAQFDNYQSSLSLILTVAGVVFSLFALAVPLMNYFFFQREQMEKLQEHMNTAAIQAETLQAKTAEVAEQLAENKRAAVQLEETQSSQQEQFEAELERVRKSTAQYQMVLAIMNNTSRDRRFNSHITPLSSSTKDKVDALYLNALIAQSSTRKINYLREALEMDSTDIRLYTELTLIYYREYRFKDLLDCATNAIEKCNELTLHDRIHMLCQSGYAQAHLEEYEKAISKLQDAIKLCETMDAGDTELARAYNLMARLYLNKGDYKQALDWAEKTKLLREDLLGSGHPATALTYCDIGEAMCGLGRYKDAVPMLKKAIFIQRATAGEYAFDTGWSYYVLGLAYSGLGENLESFRYVVKSYYANRFRNPDHPKHKKIILSLQRLYAKQESATETGRTFEEWLGDLEDSDEWAVIIPQYLMDALKKHNNTDNLN